MKSLNIYFIANICEKSTLSYSSDPSIWTCIISRITVCLTCMPIHLSPKCPCRWVWMTHYYNQWLRFITACHFCCGFKLWVGERDSAAIRGQLQYRKVGQMTFTRIPFPFHSPSSAHYSSSSVLFEVGTATHTASSVSDTETNTWSWTLATRPSLPPAGCCTLPKRRRTPTATYTWVCLPKSTGCACQYLP